MSRNAQLLHALRRMGPNDRLTITMLPDDIALVDFEAMDAHRRGRTSTMVSIGLALQSVREDGLLVDAAASAVTRTLDGLAEADS